ncbi:uncharacterized protein LOC143917255 [Arctopsyche grandis]|uniref:uncharacterized protein LOC143917255 n=1 Tax=Arctopsyche grandis TaxID=121162 RepID=UPI00406D7D38
MEVVPKADMHDEDVAKIEEGDTLGSLESHPIMKHSDTRDSISSIDSDVSLSYDRRGSDDKSNDEPETPIQEDEGAHMADLSDSASDAGSTGGGKDSGCEVTNESQETPFTPPTEELAEKIVAQVEFYFSDVNITKDAFLLKHVKRNKEGYVSLKLISSFKRVKHLTKDWRVVAVSLKKSKRLEINEAGTKLRRLEPLPQYDETTPSRTIVAVNLPIDKPSIENVSQLFSKCGEIALIRVLRPGNPIPADVRQFINKNPSLNGIVCALVEFTESESARNAVQMQNDDFPGYGQTMKVYELNGVPNPEKKRRSIPGKKPFMNRMNELEYSPCCSSSEAEMEYWCRGDPRMKFRRGSSGYIPRVPEPHWLPRRMSACSHSSDSSGYYYSPRRLSTQSSRDSNPDMFLSRRISNCSISSAEYDPMRRFSNCSQMSSGYNSPIRSRSNSNALNQDALVRPPVGPDGTKGFHLGARQRRISDLALYSH